MPSNSSGLEVPYLKQLVVVVGVLGFFHCWICIVCTYIRDVQNSSTCGPSPKSPISEYNWGHHVMGKLLQYGGTFSRFLLL